MEAEPPPAADLPPWERLSIGLDRAWDQAREAILELERQAPAAVDRKSSVRPVLSPRIEKTVPPTSQPDPNAAIDAAIEDLIPGRPSEAQANPPGREPSPRLRAGERNGRLRVLVALAVSSTAAGALGRPVARWLRRRSSSTPGTHPIKLESDTNV
jgi:hypothetical protein